MLTVITPADSIADMSNNTEATITNIDKGEKRRLMNALNDLCALTDSYSVKVLGGTEDNTTINIHNLIMILEVASETLSELRPKQPAFHGKDQLSIRFDIDDY